MKSGLKRLVPRPSAAPPTTSMAGLYKPRSGCDDAVVHPAPCRFFCACAALLLATVAVSAQVSVPPPIREYLFAGNFSDTLGGADLQPQGGSVVGDAYVFAANQGLLLTDLTLDPANYTIELSFKLDEPGGFQRLVDFKDRTSDTGLYALGSSLNFFNLVTAAEADILSGQSLHLVVTRDGTTGQFSAFINGQARFSFTDTGGLAVISGANRELAFFRDDLSIGGEAGSGAVDFIRFYNQPMDSAQVLSLFQNGPTAVPEPSVAALLALGTGLLLLRRRVPRRE